MEGLKGKVCVITGGGGVIGTSLAIGLGEAGAVIAIVDFVKEKADEVARIVAEKTGVATIGVFGNVLDKGTLIEAKKLINERQSQGGHDRHSAAIHASRCR